MQIKLNLRRKQAIESEIASLRTAIAGENVQAIKDAKSRLEQASHKFAERMYSAAAAQQQNQEGAGNAGNQGGSDHAGEAPNQGQGGSTVYDADYRVEDDDKK